MSKDFDDLMDSLNVKRGVNEIDDLFGAIDRQNRKNSRVKNKSSTENTNSYISGLGKIFDNEKVILGYFACWLLCSFVLLVGYDWNYILALIAGFFWPLILLFFIIF